MNKAEQPSRFTRIKTTMIEIAAIISLGIVLLNGLSEDAIRFVQKVSSMLSSL